MGWNDVTTTALDIKKQKGKELEGTFKGKHEITTKIGPQVIWQFVGEDGVPFGVYGFTNLNRAMESLEVGTLVKITYQGTQNIQTKYGMKDVHQVSVQVWADDDKAPVDFP
jgi:hypothetical protein